MVLELADGPRKSKYISVDAYNRKRSVVAHKRRRALNSGDNHVFVPSHLFDGIRSVWVREDKFDGLSDAEWDITMNELLEYQPGMSDLSGKAKRQAKREAKAEKKAKRSTRKDEKKAATAKRKADKNERKNQRRAAIDAKRKAKGDAKIIRAEAKQDRANRPRGGGRADGEGNEPDEDTSTGRGIFSNIIAKTKGLINKVKAGAAPQDGEEPEEGSDGSDGGEDQAADGYNIMGMNISKPVAIGVGVAAVSGILYFATKRKS